MGGEEKMLTMRERKKTHEMNTHIRGYLEVAVERKEKWRRGNEKKGGKSRE